MPARWAHDPAPSAADFLLWPIVRAPGKPGAVAAIASGMGVLALLIQKFATDNRRLLAAKRWHKAESGKAESGA